MRISVRDWREIPQVTGLTSSRITQTPTVTGETRGRVLHRASPIHRRLTWMSQETFMRLEHLRRLNSNRAWVNHDVYRVLATWIIRSKISVSVMALALTSPPSNI